MTPCTCIRDGLTAALVLNPTCPYPLHALAAVEETP